MEDARREKRYPVYATALVRNRSGGKSPSETIVAIANISRSGLGLYCFTAMRKGASVSLDITLMANGGEKQRDSVSGKVVWVSKKGSLYFIGIAFDEYLNPEKQPVLYEHFRKITSMD